LKENYAVKLIKQSYNYDDSLLFYAAFTHTWFDNQVSNENLV